MKVRRKPKFDFTIEKGDYALIRTPKGVYELRFNYEGYPVLVKPKEQTDGQN